MGSLMSKPKPPKVDKLPEPIPVERNIPEAQRLARDRTRRRALAASGREGLISAGALANNANIGFKTLLGQ